MIKHIIFGLTLATAAVSCSEDFTDWTKPQSNAQENAKSIAIQVSPVEAIDFAQLTGVDSVKVFTTNITATDSPTLKYTLNLSKTDGSITPIALTADSQCRVAVADLKAALEALYGKAPTLRELNAEVLSYATVNGETFKYTGTTTLKAQLVAPIIEESYYLIGDGIGWDYAGALTAKFLHSGGNVYDNPIFTITVPAPTNTDGTRKDFYFKLVPESCMNGGNLTLNSVIGTSEAEEDVRAEEQLKVGGKAFKQSATDGAKFYSITLNMMDYKMTVAPLSFEEYIYVPGNHQGWAPATAPALQSPKFDGIYTGFVRLDGEFKFTKVRDWKGEYNYNDFVTYPTNFVQGGGSNIKAENAGNYFLTVNVPAKSIEATPITKVGVVGAFNGWSNDVELTYNSTGDCYEGQVTLDGDKFKFRFNGDWAINLGGSISNLTQGGSDLVAPAGTYTIKLYLSRSSSNNIYCTLNP